MKKIIFLIVGIVIIIISVIIYNNYYYKQILIDAENQNRVYLDFYNTEVLGTDIASLLNKIEDSNSKNKIEKNEDGEYIDNGSNSIKVDIKFLELEDAISLEKIQKQGIERFVRNFGAMKFKCTNIEYHNKNGKVKYMYFEQIN